MKKISFFLFLTLITFFLFAELKDFYKRTPLLFVKNTGQVNNNVLYYGKTKNYILWLTKNALIFESKIHNNNKHYEINFVDSRRDTIIQGIAKTNYYLNFIKGKKKKFTYVPTYKTICYKNIYDKIDLCIYGKSKFIEYDWLIHPGANPHKIKLKFKNVSAQLSKNGNIVLKTEDGKIIHKKPTAFQSNTRINVKFIKIAKNLFSFDTSKYNRNTDLIIDPVILVFSTYLGGSDNEIAKDVFVDKNGYVYITGRTSSDNFPRANPYQSDKPDDDVFVTKITPDGSSLVFSTYIGGNGFDSGEGITVDTEGNIYITGITHSSDFPIRNPIQNTLKNGRDPFIAKINPNGTDLIYSTYMGGSSYEEWAYDIAVDSSGSAYIVGYTRSTDYPLKNPIQPQNNGWWDAFITELNPDGNTITFSSYIGSTDFDSAYGVYVDENKNIYVVGGAGYENFPFKNSNYQCYNGGPFLIKIAPNGSSLLYSSCLASHSDPGGQANAVTVDKNGYMYICGFTDDQNFPTKNPIQGDQPGRDVFVAKFSPDGKSLVFSTYLGGNDEDFCRDIALDSSGNIYLTGYTNSTNYPIQHPYQNNKPDVDTFITVLDSSGNSILFSTYIGGNKRDEGYGIKVDSKNNIFVVGNTSSDDFPTKNAYQRISGGLYDAFITKLFAGAQPKINLIANRLKEKAWLISVDYAKIEIELTQSKGIYKKVDRLELRRKDDSGEKIIFKKGNLNLLKEGASVNYTVFDKYLEINKNYTYTVYIYDNNKNLLDSYNANI